jgi:hypothetical protein
MSYEQTLNNATGAFLSQADSGKALGSTFNERKQMSTKTTLKRIALVAVSALGFGLVTAMPSKAAIATTFALNTTSVTLVSTTGSAEGNNTAGAVFRIRVTTDTVNTGLTAGETITATVVGVPTGTGAVKTLATNATDLTFQEVKSTTPTAAHVTDWAGATADTPAGQSATDGAIGSANTGHVLEDGSTTLATARAGRAYYMKIIDNGTVFDQGVYTVRFTLTDAAGNVRKTEDVKIDFVTAAANSGAKISVTSTGTFYEGMAFQVGGVSTTRNIKATLTNRDNGRIFLGNGTSPALTATLREYLGTTAADDETFTANDTGTDGNEGASATTAALVDGVYGVFDSDGSIAATGSTLGNATLTVRYGAASGTASISVLPSRTAVAANSTVSVTASGMSVLDTSTPYAIPLTAKTVTIKVTVKDGAGTPAIVVNTPITATFAWSGNFAAADVTPESDESETVYTDATGVATWTVTNANPVHGSSVTVSFEGFTSAGQLANQVINFEKPLVTTISVPAGYTAALKSTNTIKVTVLDQFLAPMANEVLQPSLGLTDANYSATPLATIKTDAKGEASFSITDAKASTTVTSDTVTFKSVTDATKSNSVKITYGTVPVVASLKGFFDRNDSAPTYSTPVPVAGIYQTGSTTPLVIKQDRNLSKAIPTSTTTTDELVAFRFQALTAANAVAAGVVVTVSAGSGGYLLTSASLKTSSLDLVTDANGYVTFVAGATATGAVTFTVSRGSVSSSASMWIKNTDNTDARYISLTAGATTATANGESVPMTVSVTDRHGNAVAGVDLSINASGVGVLSGGAVNQTVKTDSTGKFEFRATSNVAAGGTGTYTVSVTSSGTDTGSGAGLVGAVEVDSSLTKGEKSDTESITFAAGKDSATLAAEAATAAAKAAEAAAVAAATKAATDSVAASKAAQDAAVAQAKAAQDAADAATDAANEAIDAANAATDAANLAAEAADAATVAAEEARDAADAATAAVEELATQVATLMAALKAQITTLANTVAKIAKKVKA